MREDIRIDPFSSDTKMSKWKSQRPQEGYVNDVLHPLSVDLKIE